MKKIIYISCLIIGIAACEKQRNRECLQPIKIKQSFDNSLKKEKTFPSFDLLFTFPWADKNIIKPKDNC